jgi:hypothetical protein
VQLILDALDFPASIIAAGESAQTSWGIQLFDGAQVFSDPDRAGVFSDAVDRIRGRAMP